MKNLILKLKESVIAVLPVSVIILILGLSVADFSGYVISKFLLGALMLIAGMSLFSLGADIAMIPMGSRVGSSVTKTKKIGVIVIVCLLIGFMITVAEPDLLVLAGQLSSAINEYLLVATVGVGVGIFLVIAILRIVFQVKLRTLLIIFYSAVFLLAIFVPAEYLPLAFDSGGVTTGPMTVPFIIALGIGIASSKGGGSMDDSFGFVALCSVGPILSVLLLGLFSDTSALNSSMFLTEVETEGSVVSAFLSALPVYMFEVLIALFPILIFFFIFNAASMKLSKKYVVRIIIGILYVYIGLVIFLTGVNAGFSPVGKILGEQLVYGNLKYLLIPVGIIIGFFIVGAEPAVHVLTEQVEEISGGTIKRKSIMVSLMLSVSFAIGLSMLRVITGISIWWIIVPGYVISLVLTFFVPKVFTAIAFDSGGVASGPMTATFLLPFAIGASVANGGNILKDAFGLVTMVAMTPLITIQLLGLLSVIKNKKLARPTVDVLPEVNAEIYEPQEDIDKCVIDFDDDGLIVDFEDDDDIIDFDDEKGNDDKGEIDKQLEEITDKERQK